MCYRIIIDSSGELTESLKKDGHFENIPLTLCVDGKDYIDDESFDQAEFLKDVAESPNVPKSACPSPDRYLQAFLKTEAKRIYVITLSAELSGSYNSACIAKEMYEEDYNDKQIAIFNSKSASIGQTLIGIYIHEKEKRGASFEEIVENVQKYTDSMKTFFVLENLETLRKNGRMSKMKAMAANALNIKPVLGSTDDGNICMLDQARGINKAIDRIAQKILAKVGDAKDITLAISHCNCVERAMELKAKLEASGKFKEIIVCNTRGISSMYANQGGIIVAV